MVKTVRRATGAKSKLKFFICNQFKWMWMAKRRNKGKSSRLQSCCPVTSWTIAKLLYHYYTYIVQKSETIRHKWNEITYYTRVHNISSVKCVNVSAWDKKENEKKILKTEWEMRVCMCKKKKTNVINDIALICK